MLATTTQAQAPGPASFNRYRLANSQVVMPFHCQANKGCSVGWMRVREIDDRTAILTMRVAARFDGQILPRYRAQVIERVNNDLIRRGRAKNGVLIRGPHTMWRENYQLLLYDIVWRLRA
jgi:hypothetical protein